MTILSSKEVSKSTVAGRVNAGQASTIHAQPLRNSEARPAAAIEHEPRVTGTKVCKKCERELTALAFAAEKRMSDGLASDCRDCRGAAEHARKVNRGEIGGYKTRMAIIRKGSGRE